MSVQGALLGEVEMQDRNVMPNLAKAQTPPHTLIDQILPTIFRS